jgi:uncharacterized protein (TIGR03437 family)
MFRRPLILFLIVVASCSGQTAQLSAPDQGLNPGQAVVASFSLVSEGQTIAAVQFDLASDPPIGLQVTAGDQLRAASKIPYVVSTAPQKLRCLIVGLNETTIANGELLKLFLSANPASAAGAAQLRITNVVAANPAGLSVALNAVPVNVQIQNGTFGPLLPANAVLNAASLSPGPLSPGEIITLLGFNALPTVSVRINDSPAPILYAGANQINAIVPFGLDLTSAASLEVKSANQIVTMTLPVAAASPGIFTVACTGLGTGIILNEDYTPNSFANPARPGSVIMVYGTGFGTLSSPLSDGQTAAAANPTTLPVVATVTGLPAAVLYVGAAPGFIAGLTQINVQLPAGATHNFIAPLALTVSGLSTVNGATVAIQ